MEYKELLINRTQQFIYEKKSEKQKELLYSKEGK